ncbi:hypothetical protein PG996_012961 [Apiospora saccharicola]|uniref:Uncharacterized protein n=1 Tax=Apiospora saccharicola TaxID=335842 RepID=A0ABR1U6J2_9PEZI
MNAPISSPSAQRPSATVTSTSTTQSNSQHASPAHSFIAPPPPPTREVKQASTDAFLRDFNLVAEAAKRAQMACLMRDMESIGIS